MAYNFKNALVNLNEEIRKSGGGGSDLPAVKLAVSELQLSMAAVKSSVASVTAEVNSIKSVLEDLMSYSSNETIIGKMGINDIVRAVYNFESALTITSSSWVDSNIPITGVVQCLSATGFDANGTCFPLMAYAGTTYIKLQACRTSNASINGVIFEYVKESNDQKKKGGKK